MQSELKALQRELGITFLFVTHDQEEAMALSDRIALLRNGSLEQVASPREIYAHPATAYTAQFIGQTNLLRGELINGTAKCGALQWPAEGPNGSAIFSLRPEAIRFASDDLAPNGTARFRALLQQQFFSGASELLEVNCGGGQLLRVRIPREVRFPVNTSLSSRPRTPCASRSNHLYPRHVLAYIQNARFYPASPVGRLFLLLPYALMFAHSFWAVHDGVLVHQWNLHNYSTLFSKSLYVEVLLRTMRIAASVTLCSLLLGYPLAYYLSFMRARGKNCSTNL